MVSSMIYPKVHLNILVAAAIVFLPGLGVITLWPGHSVKARLYSLMWPLCYYGFHTYDGPLIGMIIPNMVISSITLFFVMCGWLLCLYKHNSNTGKRYDNRDLYNDESVTTTYFFWWF
jgi:hypothetical protein